MIIILKHTRKFALFLLLKSSFFAYANTTVFYNTEPDHIAVARSLDLYTSDLPLLITEPRETPHTGEAGTDSLQWRSKYGTVMITAFHSNAVSDGINEKGLAAHLLYLPATTYPQYTTTNPKISNLMWAKYVLDNFATVNEAIEGTKNLEIVAKKVQGKTWATHLTIEDATGDSALFEFINGKLNIYHGRQYQVVTNTPSYAMQLANLKNYVSFGGKLPIPGDPSAPSRFVRVATFLKTLPKPANLVESIAGILSVLRTALVPFGAVTIANNTTEDAWTTRWVTVADLTRKIYYFNSTTAPNTLWVDLSKVKFAPGSPILTLNPVSIRLDGEATVKLRPTVDY
ncbi:choloylglycine hydrolase [Legionella beliardensis]|uniref:Choloylglycine hydrolase n=1 Tax=Legionella beliardensis TaxID=91822 RepID=A0A378I2N7_9GAMM|nr:linear amide C-N hydrolase [Legionella beliardensis]STX29439.1 choloylglycine hydrolase [Legionella beliardensis]